MISQFTFSNLVCFGAGAIRKLGRETRALGCQRPLVVTDPGLVDCGMADRVMDLLKQADIEATLFAGVDANPTEHNAEEGLACYQAEGCDGLIGFGGGSPLDAAKAIRLKVNHSLPLAEYAIGVKGWTKMTEPMPPLIAISTTSGTGSEVGRGAVITLRETGRKTLFVAPPLMPNIAALEPALTVSLPPHLTAATGIDAFTHSLEAYFAPVYHPMADGIALEGIRICLANLNTAVTEGQNLEARAAMQIAASMGAVAFQKDLGMVHSLAHPLSACYNLHHGLANALMLPSSMDFLETADLTTEQQRRVQVIRKLFEEAGLPGDSLAAATRLWLEELGIILWLNNHIIPEAGIPLLADEAFLDTCHATNLIPVSRADLAAVYESAL